jgi:hypothetical protein
MEQAQKHLARLLRALADSIEFSSEGELEEFLSQQNTLRNWAHQLRSNRPTREKSRNPQTKKDSLSKRELGDLIERLRSLASRDEGLNLLYSAKLSKKELEQLARMMDLPVLREDDADRLRHKIVEASIGSQLNSRAIRGT